MAFRGKVDEEARPVFAQPQGHQFRIADVAVHKPVTALSLKRRKIFRIACIREQIEIDHREGGVLDPLQHKI